MLVIALVITLFFSVNLLHSSRSQDKSLIPDEWHDWVTSHWAGDTAKGSTGTQGRPSPTAAYEILETQKPVPKKFDANTQMFDLGKPVHEPAGPRPDQIVLLTATDGAGHNAQVKDIVNMAMHNRREYCARHGYINHFINMSRIEMPESPHPVWKKLPAIVETFQTYPDALWVWWLDLDAIIMTEDFELETKILSDDAIDKNLLRHEEIKKNQKQGHGVFTADEPNPREIDLLVAQDHSTINAGSFFLRRSESTQKLLTAWRDPLLMNHGFPGKEQDALVHLTATNAEIRSHTGFVNAHHFNPFWSGWKKGDLLIHLAGCWVKGHCQKNWDGIWKQRYGSLDFPPKPADETASEPAKSE